MDENEKKHPSEQEEGEMSSRLLPDQDLEGAAGGYKPMPKHPPKGLA